MAGSQSDRELQSNGLKSADLCIPIYLNQRIVFDILAIIEDGFSQLTDIKTSTSEAESQKSGMGASIGASNVFAFLKLSFKKEKGAEKGTESQTEMSQEKVHTPTSLFSKLRCHLKQQQILKEITADDGFINNITNGEFIEFQAVLRKNPLVDTMDGYKRLLNLAVLFQNEQVDTPKSKHVKGSRQSGMSTDQEILKKKAQKELQTQKETMIALTQQIDGILEALTTSNTMEVIAEILGTSTIKVVLSTELDYFSDRSVSEIIDGEFRVLGKVVRVITQNSEEKIDLLRKTSFAGFSRELFDEFENASDKIEEVGFKFPKLTTEIEGPALQVIPIAIFA